MELLLSVSDEAIYQLVPWKGNAKLVLESGAKGSAVRVMQDVLERGCLYIAMTITDGMRQVACLDLYVQKHGLQLIIERLRPLFLYLDFYIVG